ncbi:type II secretion system GspH family protein [Patescibacteria group bacterium]|nr:type II secretion system GspH family protein [Patescibacteria group bacterium]
MTKNLKNGFSLIELIVAMTIVMVVTMVGVVSYQGANRKARDGKRKADLEKIRVALEIYRQENDYYPETADSDLVPDYLQGWPDDPRNNSYYYLRGVGTLYSYAIYAQMEGTGETNGYYGENCGDEGVCNYRVNNP